MSDSSFCVKSEKEKRWDVREKEKGGGLFVTHIKGNFTANYN